MSTFIKPRAVEFVAFLEECLNEKDGYIMGATGQRPKLLSANSWWFTQYNDSKAQKAKALYWRERAPRVFDCNGLAEGFFKDATGISINTYARTNYAEWCNPKGTGKIPDSKKTPGAAVFHHNGSYISHVGFLWKPVDIKKPNGDWWCIEARGVMYGVVATKLSARSWNRWGWMTKYFDYTGEIVEPVTHKLGERDLFNGCDGDDVKQLQVILLSWNYDLGKWGADGDFGKCTEAAVKDFQEDQKIPVTGRYDARSHAALSTLLDAENDDQKPDTDPVEPPANTYPVRGVIPDISDNQGELNYDALCNGCDTAIFRARVNGKNDGLFVKHATECVKRGFPFSVYDYFTPDSEADAIKQADAMWDRCMVFRPAVYFLDCEKLADGVDYKENRKYMAMYVNRLRQRGVKLVGLYTGSNRFENEYKRIADIFDCLWIAHYGKNTGFVSNIPDAVGVIALHQYTSMGGATNKEGIRVPGAPGIKRRVDLNRMTGNKALSFFTGRKHVGTEYFGLVRISDDTVNVRSGPGAQYKKIGLAKKGDLFVLRDGSGKGWNAVKYKGQDAYISMEFTRAVDE